MSENVKVLEGWKRVKLGEVLSISRIPDNEKDPNKRITVRLWNKGVFAREVREVELNREKESTIYYKRKAGQFIYGKQNLVRGAFGVIPPELDGYCSTSDVPSFDVSKNLDVYYLDYTLRTLYKAFSLYEKGTGSKRVHEKDFLSFEIFLPPIFEQQKIAEILKTVDRAIEKTGKIIEKYKRIKQGLMQDLLTKGVVSEGEGESEKWRLRNEKIDKFKDSPLGRIPEEWEVVRLGETGRIVSGATPDTSKPQFWNGDIVWVTPDDLSKQKKYIYTSQRKISKDGLNSCAAKIIPRDSIVLSSRAPIGYLSIVKTNYATNQGCKSIILNKNYYDEDFFYYCLHRYINKMISLGSGTTFNEISKSQLAKLEVKVPCLLSEQHRIASILSQIDEVIEKEQAYKEKLERVKKGLMEDLLTGKVRVNHLIEEEEK
ncbi:restriction modification system DNA specificity domain [Fervidobacterium nodosum Rt17-B1]|uniref:Restriction modification system DNA specificity domain n=2 Tax=Fervidobacterium nodosum TaxID=2424 RepID=A7HKD8_FERNB|nr:restriction endonuclease subunit S [Fervidobacterium nodosum]ABS60371.1 restriction modification system DNA specificity domain [Fervidobacterium nodosum Rt17-B1]